MIATTAIATAATKTKMIGKPDCRRRSTVAVADAFESDEEMALDMVCCSDGVATGKAMTDKTKMDHRPLLMLWAMAKSSPAQLVLVSLAISGSLLLIAEALTGTVIPTSTYRSSISIFFSGSPSADALVTNCDSYLTNNSPLGYDYGPASKVALDHRDKWQFGYSTRLVADEARDSLEEVRLEYPRSGADERQQQQQQVRVQRGDLVLLCLHSLPDNHDTSDGGAIRKKQIPFLQHFTGTDEARTEMKNGHLVVGVMGARYAPDAIHGTEHSLVLPDASLSILGGGGTFGRAVSIFQKSKPMGHLDDEERAKMKEVERVKVPVVPVGRLMRRDGTVFNIREAAIHQMTTAPTVSLATQVAAERRLTSSQRQESKSIQSQSSSEPLLSLSLHVFSIPIYVFTGVSMNSGKSIAMSHFIRGLTRAGLTVGAAKVTGTDYPKDLQYFMEGGAQYGTTFADFGVSSTHALLETELDRIVQSAVSKLVGQGSDVVVLELADGVRAPDAAYLLGRSDTLRSGMTSLFIAARNGLGASKALDEIYRLGLGGKLGGVTGMMTSSPLAVQEFEILEGERKDHPKPPVYSPEQLAEAKVCEEFIKEWPAIAKSRKQDVGILGS